MWRCPLRCGARIGELPATDAAVLVSAFEADYFGTDEDLGRFSVVAVTAAILDRATRLIASHGLRAYDAVQLASACAASEATAEAVGLAAFDRQLLSAAAAEGLELLL